MTDFLPRHVTTVARTGRSFFWRRSLIEIETSRLIKFGCDQYSVCIIWTPLAAVMRPLAVGSVDACWLWHRWQPSSPASQWSTPVTAWVNTRPRRCLTSSPCRRRLDASTAKQSVSCGAMQHCVFVWWLVLCLQLQEMWNLVTFVCRQAVFICCCDDVTNQSSSHVDDFFCQLHIISYTGWLKIKYPTGQYTVSPQPMVWFWKFWKLLNPDTSLNLTVYSVSTAP